MTITQIVNLLMERHFRVCSQWTSLLGFAYFLWCLASLNVNSSVVTYLTYLLASMQTTTLMFTVNRPLTVPISEYFHRWLTSYQWIKTSTFNFQLLWQNSYLAPLAPWTFCMNQTGDNRHNWVNHVHTCSQHTFLQFKFFEILFGRNG